MQMRMMVQLLAPGVEDGEATDLGPEMLGVPGDVLEALRNGAKGPMLRTREGGPIACQKGGAMLAHHIGDFELRLRHGSWPTSTGKVRASRGLSVACTALAATCK